MTSLITVGLGFIFFVGLLMQWEKYKRDAQLTKRQTLIDGILVVSGILYIIEFTRNNFPRMDNPEILSTLAYVTNLILLLLFVTTLSIVILSRVNLPYLTRLHRFLNEPIFGEKHIEGMIQKGVQFYRSREELPLPTAFLSQAKQEIFVMGTTLHAIVGSNRELIKDLIVEKGVTVRLLFLDPKSKLLNMLSDCLIGESEYDKSILASLKMACDLKKELTEFEKKKLDIRTYDTIPFYTMLMLDPKSGNGIVRVEPYFYRKGERARSSFQISEKEQKDEFQKHLSGYKYLCDISKEYQCQ